MTFTEAIKQAGSGVTSVRVSKRTYAQLLIDLDHRFIDLNDHPNPSLATSGVTVMANFAGLNIYLSTFLQDGMVALFNGDALVGTVSLPPPALPLDPTTRVARVDMIRGTPGIWGAYDEDGEFLWHLTEEGAEKLAALKGLPFV